MEKLKSEVVIIGNKPYKFLDISPLLDSGFTKNVRCNMAMPGRFNGNKCYDLALCSHLHKNLITCKKTEKDFWNSYKHAYKKEEVDFFYQNFDKKNYKSVFFAKTSNKYNEYLKKIKCPHKFNAQPRTGYIAMLKEIIDGESVSVSHFSVNPEEVRETYYVQPSHYENKCHSKSDEIKIIKWLHENNYVDVSLCLLKDVPTPTFDCSYLIPTNKMINMCLHYFDTCILENLSKNQHSTILDVFQDCDIQEIDKGLKIQKNYEEND